jgi:hypothetical protein
MIAAAINANPRWFWQGRMRELVAMALVEVGRTHRVRL